MCGVDANNQIPKVLLLSLPVKKIKIGEYLAKGQARRWLSRAPCAPGQHTARDEESARDFTDRLHNKPFLIWHTWSM